MMVSQCLMRTHFLPFTSQSLLPVSWLYETTLCKAYSGKIRACLQNFISMCACICQVCVCRSSIAVKCTCMHRDHFTLFFHQPSSLSTSPSPQLGTPVREPSVWTGQRVYCTGWPSGAHTDAHKHLNHTDHLTVCLAFTGDLTASYWCEKCVCVCGGISVLERFIFCQPFFSCFIFSNSAAFCSDISFIFFIGRNRWRLDNFVRQLSTMMNLMLPLMGKCTKPEENGWTNKSSDNHCSGMAKKHCQYQTCVTAHPSSYPTEKAFIMGETLSVAPS